MMLIVWRIMTKLNWSLIDGKKVKKDPGEYSKFFKDKYLNDLAILILFIHFNKFK